MSYLIDTNVLLRRVEPDHPQHQAARTALDILTARNERLCITPQNLIEFRAVVTRPKESRGLGLTTRQAVIEADKIETLFELVPDTLEIYPEWQRLVETHSVSGLPVHDARLVAVMAVHDINHILTFNARHFRRYLHINVVEPEEIKAQLS